MKNKNVDLVIKDEQEMIMLITLVIQSLSTNIKKGKKIPDEYYQIVLQKYKWMKWRSKISYIAKKKRKTI